MREINSTLISLRARSRLPSTTPLRTRSRARHNVTTPARRLFLRRKSARHHHLLSHGDQDASRSRSRSADTTVVGQETRTPHGSSLARRIRREVESQGRLTVQVSLSSKTAGGDWNSATGRRKHRRSRLTRSSGGGELKRQGRVGEAWQGMAAQEQDASRSRSADGGARREMAAQDQDASRSRSAEVEAWRRKSDAGSIRRFGADRLGRWRVQRREEETTAGRGASNSEKRRRRRDEEMAAGLDLPGDGGMA
ncbi:PREDICTED: uncharacterized protein DDB_G0287625-like [Camelina sativa]|uniref:Uncharacterized protein DDB_G0287625-like n=1 Tax=Camelina sativa TaxID=90675 RepID=A0ABM1QWL4_CAMSA|nr:PREDICTED: uncharacterized protein DDB_G0287625-like [Camelina sativa]